MSATRKPTLRITRRPFVAGATCALAGALAVLCSPALAQTTTAPQLKPTTADQKPKPKTAPAKKTAAKADGSAKSAPRGATSSLASSSEQAIVALVNDEPITGFEIQQRAMMLAGGNVQARAQENFKAMLKNPRTTERLKAILGETIKSNQGKSKDEIIAIFEARKKAFAMDMQKQAVDSAKSAAIPGARKAALDELIDEKLKLQEAKRLGVNVSDDEVNRVLGSIAERNKMTPAQFLQQLGPGVDAMKTRIRSTLTWNDVVRRRFGAQIAVASKDVDKLVASSATAAEDDVELRVQRIRIATPAKMDQAVVAQRMADAEKIRGKFSDCKTTGQAATGVPGAKFEELGKRRPSVFQEPTRSLLLNARDGEMLPPSLGEGFVELWVVCGRDIIKADEQKRTQAEGELKQKEFELLAKRHMKDLRQDAHIEYR